MEIVNAAKHTVADINFAFDNEGREHLVLAIKATYRIPANDKKPRPLIPAQPLLTADSYVGDPGTTAPLAEHDFCLRKRKCDVVFNASAHAPEGKAVKTLTVAARVGAMAKQLQVCGERRWLPGVLGWQSSEMQPFIALPLHYGRAFGGTHVCQDEGQVRIDMYLANGVGTGYAGKVPAEFITGLPLPNLLVPGDDVGKPDDDVRPVALSALPRNHPQRRRYAGTYDDNWRQNDFPLLPRDFDDRYHQSVPEDQQIDFPRGGEEVLLYHMMAGRPAVRFRLPRLDNMPVQVLTADYQVLRPDVVVDTLYFEPDEGRFSVVWRATLPVRRKLQEFDTISVGPVCKEWWQKKTLGLSGCSSCGGKTPQERDA